MGVSQAIHFQYSAMEMEGGTPLGNRQRLGKTRPNKTNNMYMTCLSLWGCVCVWPGLLCSYCLPLELLKVCEIQNVDIIWGI